MMLYGVFLDKKRVHYHNAAAVDHVHQMTAAIHTNNVL